MRAIKLLKRFAAVILAVAGLMMFSGCGADGANGGNIVEAQIDGSGTLTAINRASKPIHKPGGGKFTLAYVVSTRITRRSECCITLLRV